MFKFPYGLADFYVSLLCYFGLLTLTPERTPIGELTFRIPNLVIRKLYVEQNRLCPSDSRGVDPDTVDGFRT